MPTFPEYPLPTLPISRSSLLALDQDLGASGFSTRKLPLSLLDAAAGGAKKVLSYIPQSYVEQMLAGTLPATTNLSQWINNCTEDAGVGGAVYWEGAPAVNPAFNNVGPVFPYYGSQIQIWDAQAWIAEPGACLQQYRGSGAQNLVVDQKWNNNSLSHSFNQYCDLHLKGEVDEAGNFTNAGGIGWVMYGTRTTIKSLFEGFAVHLQPTTFMRNGLPGNAVNLGGLLLERPCQFRRGLQHIRDNGKITDSEAIGVWFGVAGTKDLAVVQMDGGVSGWNFTDCKAFTLGSGFIKSHVGGKNVKFVGCNLQNNCTDPADVNTFIDIGIDPADLGGVTFESTNIRYDMLDTTKAYIGVALNNDIGFVQLGIQHLSDLKDGSGNPLQLTAYNLQCETGTNLKNPQGVSTSTFSSQFSVAQRGALNRILAPKPAQLTVSEGTSALLGTLAYLGVPNLTSATISRYDTFFRSVTPATLAKIDALYLFPAASADPETMVQLNLANPNINQIIKNGSVSWSRTLGYVGNGTDAWLDTQSTLFRFMNFQANNAAFYGWESNSVADGTYLMGTTGGSATRMVPRNASNQFTSRNQSLTSVAVANSDSIGGFGSRRTSSSTTTQFIDGALVATSAETQTGLGTGNACFLRDLNSYSSRATLGGFWASGALLDAEIAAIDAAAKVFFAAVGAPT